MAYINYSIGFDVADGIDNYFYQLYMNCFETSDEKVVRENKIRQAKLDAICNDTEFVWLDEYNEPTRYKYPKYKKYKK